jgi:hypothetical protein
VTYHWRVAAINDTTLGPFSSTMSFTIIPEGTVCPLYFIPHIKANCRVGASTLHGLVSVLNPGDRLPIQGRHQTQDGMWYDVLLPNKLDCWVLDKTGDLSEGDPNLIPFVIPPALPEPKKPGGGSCGDITDAKVCMNTPGCQWLRTQVCVPQ